MQHPLILQLDTSGQPARWINYERAVFYLAKDLVSWTHGEQEYTIYGGKQRKTGDRSFLDIPSIMAIKSKSTGKHKYKTPTLTNTALFRRDHCLCAYCGQIFNPRDLTRDHVIPVSTKGLDIWGNVVTACGPCNRHKDDRTPDQAGMPLLYVPYAPNRHEYLILMNRNILINQMDFLLSGVSTNSRLISKDFQELVSRVS